MFILNSLDRKIGKTRQRKKRINSTNLKTEMMPSKLDLMTSESCNNNMLTLKTNFANQQRG